jgi:hypothetical protein
MTDTPERIWAWSNVAGWEGPGFWDELRDNRSPAQVEYLRKDLCDPMADPRVKALVEAAHGLSFGEDWNAGTHAKMHRERLLSAVAAIMGNLASPQALAALREVRP